VTSRTGHTLKIKCPTWDHVQAFYAQKVKADNTLSARVPWAARPGEVVTLALELPDELIVTIEAVVGEVTPAADERKSAVKLSLIGLTAQLRARLAAMVAKAAPSPPPVRAPSTTRPPLNDEPALPAPVPTDAPLDERIEPFVLPTLDAVPAAQRAVAGELLATYAKMKASAAHEVLGIGRNASVEEVRAAYFAQVLRHHPDRLARHRSPAVRAIAQEVLILINKAYDRMRDALVAAGQAIAAGPALLPHSGWLAGFDDLGGGESRVGHDPGAASRSAGTSQVAPLPPPPRAGTAPVIAAVNPPPASAAGTGARPATAQPVKTAGVESRAMPRAATAPIAAAPPPARSPTAPAVAPAAPAPRAPAAPAPRAPTAPLDAASLFDDLAVDDGVSDFDTPPSTELVAEAAKRVAEASVETARAELERGEYKAARERLAEALRTVPRDRNARALYHVAQAGVLLADGKAVDAASQLQTALTHDPANVLARRALDDLKAKLEKKGGILGRLFSR
jgi:hypothetical protein